MSVLNDSDENANLKLILAVRDRELFQWAGAIFTSRSFISLSTYKGVFKEPFPILWPVVDIGNHRPMEKVEWGVNDEAFCLRILTSVPKGEQIYNNYAPKGNEERKWRSSQVVLSSCGIHQHHNQRARKSVKEL